MKQQRNWLFVAGLTLISLVGLVMVWNAINAYRPAYHETQGSGAQPPSLVQRLVFVIIDGLRYDVSEKMPCLQKLRSAGASARSIASFPSMSQPNWTDLVSGARPEISGAALLNAGYEDIPPIQVSHLFEAAKQAGLTTALSGQLWWSKMVPARFLDRARWVEGFDAQGDLEATQGALDLYRDPQVDLLLLYVGDYDEVSHDFGALSPEALQSAQRTDEHLCALFPQIDLKTTAVIVTSDHGQLAPGGHGGDDLPVLETPFVLAGPRVRPGQYPPIQQPDIPATIAALLGLPFPRSGQGVVRYEMLNVSESERAQGEIPLVAQRLAQADVYLSAIQAPPLPADLKRRAAGLDAALNTGNEAPGTSLAQALLAQVDQYVERQRASRINQGRLLRLPFALLGLALIGLAFAANWRAAGWAPLALALAGAAAYHAFYLLRGHVYSLSTLSSVGSPARVAVSLLLGSAIAHALGLGGLWFSSYVRRRTGRSRASIQVSMSALCAGLVGLLSVQALVAFAVNGGLGNWILTSSLSSYLLFLSLIQVALGGVLAILCMLVSALVSRIRPSGLKQVTVTTVEK